MRASDRKIKDRMLLEKAARHGCSESLAAIYLKYQPMICDFLQRSGADSITEDICQSVFMQLHQGKCSYDGSSDPKSYLFGIAKNILRNEIKATQIKTYSLSTLKAKDDLLGQQKNQICPVKSLENAEHRRILRQAIGQLPLKARQAIKLVYMDGITLQKAAQLANCDYKIFWDRLDYGLKSLKNNKNLQKRNFLSDSTLWLVMKIF